MKGFRILREFGSLFLTQFYWLFGILRRRQCMWGCFMGKAHKTPPHLPIATRKPKDPKYLPQNIEKIHLINEKIIHYKKPSEFDSEDYIRQRLNSACISSVDSIYFDYVMSSPHTGEFFMEKKTIGLIATIATTLLCACPSIFLCVWGGVGISGAPINTTVGNHTTSQPMNTGLAVVLLCIALIGLLTPVLVGFFTLRKKPEDSAINAAPMTSPAVPSAVQSNPFDNDDPLPPTS